VEWSVFEALGYPDADESGKNVPQYCVSRLAHRSSDCIELQDSCSTLRMGVSWISYPCEVQKTDQTGYEYGRMMFLDPWRIPECCSHHSKTAKCSNQRPESDEDVPNVRLRGLSMPKEVADRARKTMNWCGRYYFVEVVIDLKMKV